MMRQYELVVILKAALAEAARKKEIAAIKDLFKGAKATKEDEWGQKPFAYKIKQELAGYYYILNFESEQPIVKGYEKRLETNDNIVRYLLIRKK